MGFLPSDVVLLASIHGYEKISENATSRVISFRGEKYGPNASTRINVYYTTGTVGTCLNHPVKGKTQLFRRDILTVDQLLAIFQNPRVHTGKGYYCHRNNISQQWKSENGEFQWDSVRRWRYVTAATGMTQSDSEVKLISMICANWDSLLWNPGDAPDLDKIKIGCGQDLLMEMLHDVAAEEGGVKVHRYHELEKLWKGEMLVRDLELIPASSCGCGQLESFRQSHKDHVRLIGLMLRKLSRMTKIIVCQWLLGRPFCNCVFVDNNNNVLTVDDPLLGMAVHDAHKEYGNLFYPKKTKMCFYHGVGKNM